MKRYGLGRFTLSGRTLLPAAVILALLAAAALTGILTAQAQNGPPRVANVEIISTPATGTSYGVGEQITVKVTFDQQIVAIFSGDAQRPQLKLSIGGIQNRTARLIDHDREADGANALIFRYTVAANDLDDYGISIIPKPGGDRPTTPLTLPGGARVSGDGDDADLELGQHIIAVAYGHRVNATTPEPPAQVQAVPREASIDITWEQPGRIRPSFYIVERSYSGEPPPGELGRSVRERVSGHRRSFNDHFNLYNGATYVYRVTGYQDNWHHSRLSAAATITFRWAEQCDPQNPQPRVKNGCLPAPPPAPTSIATPSPTPTQTPTQMPTPAPTAAPTPGATATATPTRTPAPTPATTEPLEPPRVTAATHNSVTLDWSHLVGADGSFQISPTANGFHISRRAVTDLKYTSIVELPLGETAYRDTGLLPGTLYTWRVYEDHPLHRYNLIGEVTHTTMPDPTPTATLTATPAPDPTSAAADDNAATGQN